MKMNENPAKKRLGMHHQRSSSTGSHGLLFGSGSSAASHLQIHSMLHHHLHPLHSTANPSSGSPEVQSDSDDGLLRWESNGASVTGPSGAPEMQGCLSKWTNYIHGWQDRYVVLKEGSLVYFKSEFETDFGCRGAISVDKCTVKPHELDELRFDVSVSDCVWYLRASRVEDRQKWIDTLESHKKYVDANGGLSEARGPCPAHLVNLRRHDSALSLTSNASKGALGGHCHQRELKEKLAEMDTFREIVCKQIDKLQDYFDTCSRNVDLPPSVVHGVNTIDFKGEAITFKATTAGILATMSHCIDLMAMREEVLKRKLEREQTARKRIEEKYKQMAEKGARPTSMEQPSSMAKMVMMGGPDYEEGPNSQIGEDEFFDAVDHALDKLQEEQDYRDKLKLMSEKLTEAAGSSGPVSEAFQHPLWPVVDKVTLEQLHYARLEVGQDSIWELFAEDGEMRMYKREEEVDGLVVDPLKALHQVRGVTARELCHFFFGPEYRMEWETTVEQATVLEKLSEDTMIFLQLHKRVWPAAQRDALFWSHLRRIPAHELQDGYADTWIVCNKSTKHPDAPENQGGCLRVDLTVCFVCDTMIEGAYTKDTVPRDKLKTKITYCSVVNPGGWAPASVLRAVYKREYPKFLKRFTQYVIDKTQNSPIMW